VPLCNSSERLYLQEPHRVSHAADRVDAGHLSGRPRFQGCEVDVEVCTTSGDGFLTRVGKIAAQGPREVWS